MDKNGNKIALGLDVSTQCIGICILIDDGSEYGKIVELTHINPKVPTKIKGIEQLFLKKRIFEEFLVKYKDFGCFSEERAEYPTIAKERKHCIYPSTFQWNGF